MNDLTKIAGRLIGDVRDLVDWGVEGRHIDEQQLRLTIEARRARAKELTDAGMSQREAAKTLGVHHSTVQADLAENPPPKLNAALRARLNWLQNKRRCRRSNTV